MVKNVTSDQLKKTVLSERMPAIVLFTGTWCVDCTAFRPTWQKWSNARDGPILVLEIRRGDHAWDDWSIREIPTVIAYKDGKELGRASDQISEDDLERLRDLMLRP